MRELQKLCVRQMAPGTVWIILFVLMASLIQSPMLGAFLRSCIRTTDSVNFLCVTTRKFKSQCLEQCLGNVPF